MDTNLYEKRTNVQSQQTNTFHKGMDTDTSDILLGSDQYRYAQNLRITVDGSGTSGELHTIRGTERVDDITNRFEDETVLSFSTIRDMCVAILYKEYTEENDNTVKREWRIVKWNADNPHRFTTVFGPSNKPIWEGENGPELKTLSTVLRWESEKNVKYYIANGVTELLGINIGEQDTYPFVVGGDITVDNVYEKAFQYQGDGLPLMTAEVSKSSGSLKPAMVQYAYRLYIQNGAASDMSPLTKPIYLVKSAHEGYAQTETTSRAVDLRFPNTEVTGNLYIQIYRINYQQNGQLPIVDIIVDQPFVSEMYITDSGQSVQSVSAAEFLSELDTHIIPKMIESKGDILYAANIKDGMAETAESFIKFDARSYSKGNVYDGHPMFENGIPSFDDIDNTKLTHSQFQQGQIAVWNKDYWKRIEVDGHKYNGVGKYIKWEYVYDDENPKYRAGEVYRFGIVLYDKHGKAAPVQWIADIMIPDYYNYNPETDYEGELYYNYHTGIKFYVDIPADSECSAYDIVRCDRDFSSRYTLFQGIVGFTTCTDDSESTCFHPGFFTLDKVITTHNAIVDSAYEWPGISKKWWIGSCNEEDRYKPFKVKRDLLMFACPEYCYNHTQVTDLLNNRQDFQLYIVDRRDVDCVNGQSTLDLSIPGYSAVVKAMDESYYKRTEGDYLLRDDDRMWVHSPAMNILDNHTNSLNYAGLGFKIANVTNYNKSFNINDENCILDLSISNCNDLKEGDRFLELNAGFINLQSRVDVNSDFNSEIDQKIENGTWRGEYEQNKYYPNVPQAWREQYDTTANRVCTFFNWFGQHNNPYDENQWHNRSSSVIERDDNGNDIYSKIYHIRNIEYVDARQYDQFVEGKSDTDFNIKAFDQTTSIQLKNENINFINWSLGSLSKQNMSGNLYETKERIQGTWNVSEDVNRFISYFLPTGIHWATGTNEWLTIDASKPWYPIGGGDDLILLSLDEDATRYNITEDGTAEGRNVLTSPRIYVANIKKPCTPYGGYTDSAIKSSKFYSFGNYVSIKDQPNDGNLIHTEKKISGGDTFVTRFKYNALHWWNNAVYNKGIAKMCTIYDTLLETDVNIDAQYGYVYRIDDGGYTKGEYKIQHDAVDLPTGEYSQNKNSYMYNSGYSCRPNLIPKTPDNKTAGETSTYDTRIQYSNRKTNNESIDSWMDFKSNNFLDVDSRFGEITDIKLFKDKLMFWQNNAAGILSTNERTILQNTDDASIILGDGSVLQRFDYISQIYGQKPNQHTACPTNSNMYWWDEYRKEILHYAEGYTTVPLSTVKLVKNYISERTPVDVPTISYDVDNNEVICHVVTDDKVADQSLVFNEAVQAFTAVYTFSPVFYGLCMYKQYMIGDNKLYEYNVDQDEVTLFDQPAKPKVKFVINTASDYTKTFDIQVFGGRFYGGGSQDQTATLRDGVYDTHRVTTELNPITFSYSTPLKQHASINAEKAVTNAEYDFRLTIPRDGEGAEKNPFDVKSQWGNRLRGKLMQVELSSDSNSSDFALHYITTKYRISWI